MGVSSDDDDVGRIASTASLPILREPLTLGFDALWKGKVVGHYTFTIDPSADGCTMRVAHSFLVRIKIGFVTVYRYEHEVEEVWGEEGIISLSSRTNDDGKREKVRAQRTSTGLKVDGPAGTREVPASILTTTCAWDSAFITHREVLDASDGTIVPLSVRPERDHASPIGGDVGRGSAYHFSTPYLEGTLCYVREGYLREAAIERKGQRLEMVRHA